MGASGVVREVRQRQCAGDVAGGDAEPHRSLRQRLLDRRRPQLDRTIGRARRSTRALSKNRKADLRVLVKDGAGPDPAPDVGMAAKKAPPWKRKKPSGPT